MQASDSWPRPLRPTLNFKIDKALMALGQAAIGDNARSDLPNIVIYLSDDHSQFDCELYGANDIPTPNFEKLASAGMVFTHAFVASPSCAPSRAAMLTGSRCTYSRRFCFSEITDL